MRAIYSSERNESSVIYINCKNIGDKKDWENILDVADKLVEYGYSVCHADFEESIMLTSDPDFTISRLKEDYKEAKLECSL